ncbi:Thioredoxin M5, chloroplastic [Capsicum chinense]|nr:Thioredoxin M5, chloroplastic [Capsicum chinense]
MSTILDSIAISSSLFSSTNPRPSPPFSAAWNRRTHLKLTGFSTSYTSFNNKIALSSSSRICIRRTNSVSGEASDVSFDVPVLTEETWDSLVLNATEPVVVEFWAPWCGPCRMFHPVISELAKQYTGRVRCFKLNTDDSPTVASRYGIRSIPTIMIFVNGEKKDAIIGAVPKTSLTASIDRFL